MLAELRDDLLLLGVVCDKPRELCPVSMIKKGVEGGVKKRRRRGRLRMRWRLTARRPKSHDSAFTPLPHPENT